MSDPIQGRPPVPGPFSLTATQAAIHATLDAAYAAIPPGDTHAVLLDGTYSKADGPGGRIVFAQRVPGGWQMADYLGYDKPHGATAGVELAKSW